MASFHRGDLLRMKKSSFSFLFLKSASMSREYSASWVSWGGTTDLARWIADIPTWSSRGRTLRLCGESVTYIIHTSYFFLSSDLSSVCQYKLCAHKVSFKLCHVVLGVF